MLQVVLTTLLRASATLLFVVFTVFILLRTFADPAELSSPFAADESFIEQRRDIYGLDDPYYIQFRDYLANVVRLDFGDSYIQGRDATEIFLERLPRTLALALPAIVLATLVGVTTGLFAAYFKGSFLDQALSTISFAVAGLAEYWLGLMLIILFAVEWQVLPSGGYGIQNLILPVVTLAVRPTARIFQITRGAVAGALAEPYTTTARSKGLTERTVVTRHAVKNSAIVMVTLLGFEFARLLAGATILVEVVFSWPGVGSLAVDALRTHDLPVVEATVFFVAVMVVTINSTIDLCYTFLDPRVRVR